MFVFLARLCVCLCLPSLQFNTADPFKIDGDVSVKCVMINKLTWNY